MAVGNDEVPEIINIDKIDAITFHKIHTDLLPVKRSNEDFALIFVKETVKQFLSELMQLSETEKEFLEEFRQKRYRPELLFEDEEIVNRFRKSPNGFVEDATVDRDLSDGMEQTVQADFTMVGTY